MRRTARAFDGAGYDRWCTLTRTPTDWRQGLARLRHALARDVGEWEWAFVREQGAKTGMLHVHAVVRGPYLDKRRLSRQAVEAGFGKIVHIGLGRGRGAFYAAKAARYAGKAQGGWPETLELNDGRGWHQSRGYTRGVPMRDFVPRYAPSTDPGPWRLRYLDELPEGRLLLAMTPTIRELCAQAALSAIDEHVAELAEHELMVGFLAWMLPAKVVPPRLRGRKPR